MAVNIKLKRSNVQGRVPDASSLELGEIALNTYDGKAFMKKSDDSVIEIGAVSTSSISASYADTAGFAITAGSASYSSTSTTASYSLIATSASYATTASYAANVPLTASYANNATSASYALTASYAANVPQTASYAISASYASTASSADDFLVRGTLTAQTIVAQYITSSTEFITGSTKFGTQLTDTHQFTGSVSISGSLGINGVDYNSTSASFDTRITNNSSSIAGLSNSFLSFSSSFSTGSFTGSFTGSLEGTASHTIFAEFAPYAFTSSYASTASYVKNAQSASYAGDYTLTSSFNSFTSSYITDSGSVSIRLTDLEAFSSSLDSTFATDAQLNYSASILSGSTSALSASFLSVSASNSTRISDLEAFSSSLDTTFATDTDLNALSSSFIAFTSSINSYTSSNNDNIAALYAATSSLNNVTSSLYNATASLYAASASINNFSASILSYTASNNANISQLFAETASLQASTASLYAFSASILNFTSSTNNSITDIRVTTASLYAFSASINSYTASVNASITQLYNETSSLNAATASLYNATASLYNFSASINAFTASQNILNGTFATTASNTFYGTETISGSLKVSGSTNLTNLTASGLNYPSADNGALSFIQSDGAGNLSLQYVEQVFETIRNMSGATLAKGTPVYISGSTGDNGNAYIADAADANKMPAVYIAGETLGDGATGLALVGGRIEGVNTTGYPAGTIIYVAEGGGWTDQRPTGSNSIVQVLGVVQKEGVGGQGVVINQLEATLPNLQTGYTWVGNGSNQPVAVSTSSIQNVISASHAGFAETIASGLNITASNLQINNNTNIGGNLVVNGTASFNYVQTVTGSAIIIGQEYIILNTQSPASRFAGLKVYDSGSINTTASIVWDSERNHLVYQNASGSSYSGGGFMSGPRNTGSLGDETYPTLNRILRGQGGDHLYDSNIFDDNNLIRLEINTAVTGTLNVTNGITGSLLGNVVGDVIGNVTGDITGNLIGTASYSSNTDLLDGLDSTQFVLTSSFQNYSASIQAFSASILNTTASYNTFSASINAYTSSNNAVVTQLYNTTSSLYAFSASINNYTSSNDSVITSLYSATASLNDFSASILNYTSSTNATITQLQNATASLYTATASIYNTTQSLSASIGLLSSSFLAFSDSYNTGSFSGSLVGTASWAVNALNTATASSADDFLVRGTLTAQTINVQTITSSVEFVTGSTKFGTIVTNTHQFTGSVSISGSLAVNNSNVVLTNQTSSMSVATASFVTTAQTASFVQTAQTASFVQTAQTASYVLNAISSSFALTASYASNVPVTASYAVSASNAISSSFASTASYWSGSINNALSASYAATATSASNALTASYVNPLNQSVQITGSLGISGSTGTLFSANVDTIIFTGSAAISGTLNVTNGITGSLLGTASFASTASFVQTAQTASYVQIAQTASFVNNAQTASFVNNAQTASFVNIAQTASFVQTAQTASFVQNAVSSSYALTASYASNVPQTASYAVSASNSISSSYALTASYVLSAGTATSAFPYINPTTITGSVSIPDNHNGLLVSPISISGSITIGSGSSLLTVGPITSSTSASFASTSSYSNNILGATNYIAKFIGDNTLSSSIMYENNGRVGVNDTSPTHRFQVSGDVFTYNSSNTLNTTKYSLIGALNSTVTGSETNQYANTGIYGSLGHSATSGTFTPQDDSFVSAFLGQFNKSGGGNISGKVSSFAAGINLSGAGNVTTIAGFRAYAPLQSFALPSFSGTLTNYVGLLIDDITGTTDVGSQITNKYGIYQTGTSDKNHLAGATTINNVLQLGQLHPLPSGTDGQLAVSASNLYFFSGSAWNKISFA